MIGSTLQDVLLTILAVDRIVKETINSGEFEQLSMRARAKSDFCLNSSKQ